MANLAVIPISVHKGPPIRTKRGRMIILTPQEMLALLKAAKNRSTRDWAMILLAYRHGLRASEVCGIKLADVDLKAGSISIRRLKGSLHTIQPFTSTAGSRCWTRRLHSGHGCASGRRTARTICSPARKEENSAERSSFATFRRLPKALACRSRSAIRMS